jgi:hypothetical protein
MRTLSRTLLCLGGLLALNTVFAQSPDLPFSFTLSTRTENLPPYVTPPRENLYNSTPNFKVGWGIDSPTGFVLIDGEVWVIFNVGNQYGTTVKVARFKGRDFEHTERQSDGVIEVGEQGVSTHFCGGMWYDGAGRKLYAPIHCEYDRGISPPAGWSRKKTRLATSTDKGLTWKLEGDILTSCLPEKGDWLKFSGPNFEVGPGDFDFYVDTRGGYFYIFTCNAYAPKNGRMNNFLWFNEVARCAISDKMAPGKWHKFCNGTWTEPGLRGKSSRVCMGSTGIYGRVIYSRYLGKYLRIGSCLGVVDKRYTDLGFSDGSVYISSCDDLNRQEWTPLAKLFDSPENKKLGYTLTDGDGVGPFVCDRSLRVYNYWLYDLPSRALDVTLTSGTTPFAGYPRYSSYAYEPLRESGDTIVSRKTKIIGSADTQTVYRGAGWRSTLDVTSFEGSEMECTVAGSSVEFTFKGTAIYWRAMAGKEGGKADVYIDGDFAGTVDCYFQDAVPFQFAFIKTGLDPKLTHTIRAVIRSDRNSRSAGSVIRHVAFERSAESYWASADFCSINGKNRWWYKKWDGKGYDDLVFPDFASVKGKPFAGSWGTEETCIVGSDFQMPGHCDAVRAWEAPHSGKVRIEGTVQVQADSGGSATAVILKNTLEVWPSRTLKNGAGVSHDSVVDVERGDFLYFIAGKGDWKGGVKVGWDPVVTFEGE